MFGWVDWLRAKARNAVLAGVGDALAELERSESPDLEQAGTLLAERVRPALPAPAEAEPRARGRTKG